MEKRRTMIFEHLNLDAELTPRQEVAVKLLGTGLTYDEVCDKMFVSRRGLDTHTALIRKKINGFDRADIVIFAIKTNLVQL
jgi:DNA-binding CsgD family transcriptional regulator